MLQLTTDNCHKSLKYPYHSIIKNCSPKLLLFFIAKIKISIFQNSVFGVIEVATIQVENLRHFPLPRRKNRLWVTLTMPYLDRIEFTIGYFEWRHDSLDGITIAFRNFVKLCNGKLSDYEDFMDHKTWYITSSFWIWNKVFDFFTPLHQNLKKIFTYFVKEHLTKVIHFFESIFIEFNSFLSIKSTTIGLCVWTKRIILFG